MSRTKRSYETWVTWLDGWEDRMSRDGCQREAPQHQRTDSNAGWAMEGIRKRKSKRWAKRRRVRDDRLERKRDDFQRLEEGC